MAISNAALGVASLFAPMMNLSAPILNAYMMSMVSRDERASASGVITMAWNGTYAAGSAASGVLMGIYLDSPIYVGSLLYISSSIALYAYFGGWERSC